MIEQILKSLGASAIGYYAEDKPASEPTALATLLLLAHHRTSAAKAGLDWLLARQQPNGALGVNAESNEPRWPTGLGLLCFQRAKEMGVRDHRLNNARDAAVDWILGHQGEAIAADPSLKVFGHNTTLVAWPWVLGTHSWIEPTCLHLIALHASGYADHPRAIEARRLLADRILPEGGCNYGNTFVLEQELRPHLQPSGMLAAALSVADDCQLPLQRTVDYLRSEAARTRAAASLAWAELGIAANTGIVRRDRLQAAAQRTLQRGGSPYRLALLGLALLGDQSPLLPNPQEVAQS